MGDANQFDLLETMLGQIKIDDPGLRELIKRQIDENQKWKKQKDTNKEVIRCLRIQNKKLQEQVRQTKEQLKQDDADKTKARTALNYLLTFNRSLSLALGSCHVCWGEDPDCPECNGKGSPGWREVNKKLFNMYILPCLEKLYGLVKQ